MEHLLNTSNPHTHIPPGAELPSVATAEQVISPTDPTQTLNLNTNIKIDVQNAIFFYGSKQVLFDVTLPIREKQVTALIGPSGCGKSTFLRTLNRMSDIIPGTRIEGTIHIDGQDIHAASVDVVDLRRRVGMVFQKSNPFPKSIFDNVAYGLRINGMT